MHKIKIAPSLLSSDFSIIGQEVSWLDVTGADYIHVDVMDGVFVNNITFGSKLVKDIRPFSSKIFDVHLMIVNPKKHIESFVKAGADIITVHYEACGDNVKETLESIKSFGIKCALAINPNTPFSAIKDYVPYCDMILVMCVYPGFGGQAFIPEVLPKIREVAEFIKNSGKNIDIEVDGGINLENVKTVKDAGANVIVAGNTVYKAPDKKAVIENLRNI